ncbi:MAG: putative nucleic acid-binding protein [Candidatus Nitrosomirales archaeon]
MKIFVDVNVFIDVQRKREGWIKSFEVIRSVLEGENEGYVSALTPAIIYFLRKPLANESKAREEMLDSVRDFKIVDLTSKIVKDAADDKSIGDFEDAIQFHSAKDKTRILITRNKRDYGRVSSRLEILTPEQFLEKYK